MTEKASSEVHLVLLVEGVGFLIAVISCGSWLSELSLVALCSDLQRYYTWDSPAETQGLLAEIVGEKIVSKYQGANQSQSLIFFHTNHFSLIRYNFPSIKLYRFQERVRK